MSDFGGISGTPIGGGTPFAGVRSTDLPAANMSVEAWRMEAGVNPWHFWGLKHTQYAPVLSNCNAIVTQYAWQADDAVGRNDIAQALLEAEQVIRVHAGFPIGKTYTEATIAYPRPSTLGLRYSYPPSNWLPVSLPDHFIRQAGVEAREIIDSAAPVVYSDRDSDNLQETFTVVVATDVSDPDEIALYFSSDDRLDEEPLSERWRIGPVKVTIDNGTATIIGKRWMLGRPIKFSGSNIQAIRNGFDISDSANFVTTATVCRRYTNTEGQTTEDAQAVLVWESRPFPQWAIPVSSGLVFSPHSLDPAAQAYAIARVGIRDAVGGFVTVGEAVYNSAAGQWVSPSWGGCRQPDRVIVRYEAGVRLPPMESQTNSPLYRTGANWATIVAGLAAARMPRRIATCDVANRKLWEWQFTMSRAAGLADEQYRISDSDLNNPLGTKKAEIQAWRAIVAAQRQKPILVS